LRGCGREPLPRRFSFSLLAIGASMDSDTR
jgi:hypothetical protein